MGLLAEMREVASRSVMRICTKSPNYPNSPIYLLFQEKVSSKLRKSLCYPRFRLSIYQTVLYTSRISSKLLKSLCYPRFRPSIYKFISRLIVKTLTNLNLYFRNKILLDRSNSSQVIVDMYKYCEQLTILSFYNRLGYKR